MQKEGNIEVLMSAVLHATSLENITQFYLAIGGRQTDGSENEFAIVNQPGVEFIILQAPMRIASQIVIENPPAVRSATPCKSILEMSLIDDVLQFIAEFGGKPAPGAKTWKFQQFLVQDIVDPE
jgi:hypothetical protein